MARRREKGTGSVYRWPKRRNSIQSFVSRVQQHSERTTKGSPRLLSRPECGRTQQSTGLRKQSVQIALDAVSSNGQFLDARLDPVPFRLQHLCHLWILMRLHLGGRTVQTWQ